MQGFEALERKGTYSVKYDEAKKKFGTDDLLPLWVADMDFASALCVQEAVQKRASHPLYGYTVYPPRYDESISSWMQKRYGFKIEKEWIVPCYGVVPSLGFAISAFSQEGDGILIQTPLYPPFASSIKHKKRVILDNTLVYNEGCYTIDFDDFEAKASKAKLFLLCSPHNPTGRLWSKEELEQMIVICIRHDVLIVSDEIHADIVYDGVHHTLGKFEQIARQCIIFNAPSKSFNIAGLNTSYAIIPDAKIRHIYEVEQAKSGITNPNPFGIEALMAAYEEGEVWLEALKNHLRQNRAYVQTFLAEHKLPITPVPTEATYLMWLDCKGLGLEHEALVDFFVKKAKLGLNDGESFGKTGEGFMRLNIGTSLKILQEAMMRMYNAHKDKE